MGQGQQSCKGQAGQVSEPSWQDSEHPLIIPGLRRGDRLDIAVHCVLLEVYTLILRPVASICQVQFPVQVTSKLGCSPFSYGPSVWVRAGCRNEVVDVCCVHKLGRCLVQGCDADVSHRGLQFILHDWWAQLESRRLSRHPRKIFTYYQSNAPLLPVRSSSRIACSDPCPRPLRPGTRP